MGTTGWPQPEGGCPRAGHPSKPGGPSGRPGHPPREEHSGPDELPAGNGRNRVTIDLEAGDKQPPARTAHDRCGERNAPLRLATPVCRSPDGRGQGKTLRRRQRGCSHRPRNLHLDYGSQPPHPCPRPGRWAPSLGEIPSHLPCCPGPAVLRQRRPRRRTGTRRHPACSRRRA